MHLTSLTAEQKQALIAYRSALRITSPPWAYLPYNAWVTEKSILEAARGSQVTGGIRGLESSVVEEFAASVGLQYLEEALNREGASRVMHRGNERGSAEPDPTVLTSTDAVDGPVKYIVGFKVEVEAEASNEQDAWQELAHHDSYDSQSTSSEDEIQSEVTGYLPGNEGDALQRDEGKKQKKDDPSVGEEGIRWTTAADRAAHQTERRLHDRSIQENGLGVIQRMKKRETQEMTGERQRAAESPAGTSQTAVQMNVQPRWMFQAEQAGTWQDPSLPMDGRMPCAALIRLQQRLSVISATRYQESEALNCVSFSFLTTPRVTRSLGSTA
jgi:hypothetical protein